MATVKDANLVLSGIVVGVNETTDFNTKEPNGATVLVSAEGGFSNVKLDLSQLAQQRPSFGDFVAWMVALSPYKMENRDAAMSVRFVRVVTRADLEGLSTIVGQSETAASK